MERKFKTTITFEAKIPNGSKLRSADVTDFNRRLKNYLSEAAELIAISEHDYEYLDLKNIKVNTQ